MKTFNEIMKIRDEPDNKPEVTKRKFQVKKTNNEKMQAFGWASVAIAENGETLEDWQGDIIEPDELESAAYKFVDLYREGGEMHERGGVAYLIESVVFTEEKMAAMGIPGQVEDAKNDIDAYVKEKEADLKGEDGNVCFVEFRIQPPCLLMRNNPEETDIEFRLNGSKLEYKWRDRG